MEKRKVKGDQQKVPNEVERQRDRRGASATVREIAPPTPRPANSQLRSPTRPVRTAHVVSSQLCAVARIHLPKLRFAVLSRAGDLSH